MNNTVCTERFGTWILMTTDISAQLTELMDRTFKDRRIWTGHLQTGEYGQKEIDWTKWTMTREYGQDEMDNDKRVWTGLNGQ